MATKEKSPLRLGARLAPLLVLLAAVVAPNVALANSLSAPQTRAMQNPLAAGYPRQAESPQVLILQQENAGSWGYDASESCLAPSRTVIGKMKDLENLGPGENTLLKHMTEDMGSPKLNWQQNSSVLRTEMNKGLPMRDASVDGAGNLVNNNGFLGAERNLLQNHGWTYNPQTRLWNPPAAK